MAKELTVFASLAEAEKVKSCIRSGMKDHERIARLIGKSVKDLERLYPVELGMTDDEDLAVVSDVAFQMAVCGRFPHMTQWWLRCRGGSVWQDKQAPETNGQSPIVVVINNHNKG